MPFSRPSLSELIARARDDFDARMPGADSRLRFSVLDVLARIHAGALNGVYGLIDFIWRQVFPDTAEAGQLARWAAIWGVARKPATPATGSITVTGSNGAIVPAGTLLTRADGVDYATIAAATIVAGTASVAIQAVEGGADGNALAGQVLGFVTPVGGVNAQAVFGAGGASNGAGEEEDERLRARLLDRIQQPPHGGNRSDYVAWALSVPGVTRAWVYPGEIGLGTVTLRFVTDGRANIMPLVADLDAVAAVIDAARPVTADVHVVAPIAVPVDFILRAVPATPAVRAAIEEELRDLVRREGEPGGVLLISHVREAVSLAAGETDHEMIAPSANLTFSTGAMPVFGTLSFAP